MIFAIAGAQSPFFDLTVRVVEELFRDHNAELIVRRATSLEELRLLFAERGSRSIAVLLDLPSPAVVDVIKQSRCPVLFAADAAGASMVHLMTSHGIDAMESLRIITKSLSILHDLAILDRVLKITGPIAAHDHTHYDAIAAYLGFRGTRRGSEAVKNVQPTSLISVVDWRRVILELGANQPLIEAIEDVLSAFEAISARKPVSRVTWRHNLFHAPDPAAASPYDAGLSPVLLEGDIDLTGPGRLLFFGPYLRLPAGTWKASAHFSVSGNRSGNALILDTLVHPQAAPAEILFEAQTELPNDGRFVASFVFKVTDPSAALSIRGLFLRGSIDTGQLAFKHVELVRI